MPTRNLGAERRQAGELLGFPISMTLVEINLMSKVARLVDPEHCCIDIGTRNGGSALILAMSTQGNVYTIDILPDPRLADGFHAEIPPLREHWDSHPSGSRIHQVTCCSWDYVHEDKREPIGLVFVDGGHEYEEIKADWEHFWPKLVKGGYMLCHDYDVFPGVTSYLDRHAEAVIDMADSLVVFQK